MNKDQIRVLIVTSEWPDIAHPYYVPFLVQQVNFLRKAGIEVAVFSFRGKANLLQYIMAWWNLRRSYSWKDYDLVHAHWGQSGLVALPCPLPIVVTFHGSDLQGIVGDNGKYTLRGKVLQFISRWVSRYATKNIVVSKSLLSLLPKGTQAEVISCGVDFDIFFTIPQAVAREKLGLPTGKRLILFAADPSNPIKRFQLASDVVERLKAKFEVELVNIYNVPHDLVPIYMNGCDVLLLTSLHEGSPTIVKEALVCRLPIVSVNVGDVRERIGQVPGCYLCQDDDIETIARCLEVVIIQPYRLMPGINEALLDERKNIKNLISIYQSVLNNS